MAAPWNDIFCVKKCNTASGTVEIHKLNADNKYTGYSLQTATAMPQIAPTDADHWTFRVDHASHNVGGIKCHMTGSHSTEVHSLCVVGNQKPYDKFKTQLGSCCACRDPANMMCADFLAANGDLICITKDANLNKAVIMRFSAATAFRECVLLTATHNIGPGVAFQFMIAPNDDLFCITSNVHVNWAKGMFMLSASTGYQQVGTSRFGFGDPTIEADVRQPDGSTVHTVGVAGILSVNDNSWQFLMAPNRDIVGIKMFDTASKKTEVHVWAAANEWNKKVFQGVTCLPMTDNTWDFTMPFMKTRDYSIDLANAISAAMEASGQAMSAALSAELRELTFQFKTDLAVLDAIDVDSWNNTRLDLEKRIVEVALSVEKLNKDGAIVETTAGAVGILSGLLTIGGIIAAPFTFGASLGLTVAGTALGVSSAVLDGSVAVMEGIVKTEQLKAIDAAIEAHKEPSDKLNKAAQAVVFDIMAISRIVNIATMASLKNNEAYKKMSDEEKNWAVVFGTGKLLKNAFTAAYSSFGLATEGGRIALAYASLTARGATFSAPFMKLIKDAVVTPAVVAPEFLRSLPKISEYPGGVIFKAASTGAKVFEGVFAVAAIGAGIYDIVDGAKKLNQPSEAAVKLRSIHDNWEAQRKLIMETTAAFKKKPPTH